LCIGLSSLGVGQVALAEDDPTVNRLLASQCAQCHGTNGYAVGDMDGLFDESYKDLYEDLMDMRGEDRPEDIMDHQALGYTDDQIRRIALYYGMRSGKTDDEPENGDGGREEHEEHEEHEEETRRSRRKRER
jgi:sulfide dehydrogenase cytochrome subunit